MDSSDNEKVDKPSLGNSEEDKRGGGRGPRGSFGETSRGLVGPFTKITRGTLCHRADYASEISIRRVRAANLHLCRPAKGRRQRLSW